MSISADLLSLTGAVATLMTRSQHPVIVTGAGGWLGRTFLEMLDNAAIPGMSVAAFGKTGRQQVLRSGRTIECQPLALLDNLELDRPVILHCAFLTREQTAGMSLNDYVDANGAITDRVLAAARRMGAAGIFLPSSGAVYRADGGLETDIDRNPYGYLKVRDEQLFGALAASQHIPLSIIRIFNLGGPFVNKGDAYVLSSIIQDILAGRPITLRADRPVIRSYTHVVDVANLGLYGAWGGQGADATPFDTAGEMEVEVGDLAARVARVLGVADWPVHRPALSGQPANRYVGDGAHMRTLAGLSNMTIASLDKQIVDTARYLGWDGNAPAREVVSIVTS